MEEIDNNLYLKQIATVGEQQKIFAVDDVLSVTGIKLLGKESCVNTDVYEKLLSHKLVRPIEESLSIENGLTCDEIIRRLDVLSKTNVLAKQIYTKLTNKELVSRVIKSLAIPKTLLFKLTILDESIKKVAEHDFLVALTSIYLGHRMRLEMNQIGKLAYAALFLDIGVLHLDSHIFTEGKPLTDDERRQIYSHPIIAALIVNAYTHDEVVSLSIMDHHEHADGSGYPKGKRLNDISQNGQILGIAELAASLSDVPCKYGYKTKIQAILKFNSEQYEHDVLLELLALVSSIEDETDVSAIDVDQKYFVNTLSKLWSTINSYMDSEDVEASTKGDIDVFIIKHVIPLRILTVVNTRPPYSCVF